jgi:Disaggregatase related
VRNYIHDVGTDRELEHGIYMQTSGVIARNVIVRPSAYGISLYSSPSNVDVFENTIVGASPVEAAISVNTRGTGVRVLNNIFAFNRGYGVNIGSNVAAGCCVVDNNLIFGNAAGAVRGGRLPVTGTIAADPLFVGRLGDDYRVQPGSPAVDAARGDGVYFFDRDGALSPLGAGADLGAYER